MDTKTTKKLEAAGWKTVDARDFLELSEAEAEFIEMKLALAQDLRARRLERHLNQTQVARIVGSSQSRVAKMEAADPSVSIDLLVKSLLELGAARKDLANALREGPVRAHNSSPCVANRILASGIVDPDSNTKSPSSKM